MSELQTSNLKTSWTKYDIVRVMEVIYNIDTIERFKNKEVAIDEPILRSFLGIKSLAETIPNYWIQIQNYPNEKKLFALFATIFTHWDIIQLFASHYTKGEMKGALEIGGNKHKLYTNIRSALVESGASEPSYRRSETVPYDFTPIFQKPEVGKLFKEVLLERVSRITSTELTNKTFYEICLKGNFHKALSLTQEQFTQWLEGESEIENRYISSVKINNLFSIEDIFIEFQGSKEIYFLGENGDGKSLVLMGIYLAFNSNFVLENTDKEKTGKVVDIIKNNKRLQLLGIDEVGTKYDPSKSIYLENFFAYGTHRGRYSPDNSEAYGFMSLFDSDQTLIDPVYWLKDQHLIELEQLLEQKNNAKETKVNQFSYPTELLQRMFHDLLEKNVEVSIDSNGVLFKEKGRELFFEQLSEGYKVILIFVSDLLFRLSKTTKHGQDATKLKGIVLVDEIDLHLHPKWQRVIIKKLRTFFPNLQFIFTTHSPTIIQGASEDALLFRVFRSPNDGNTIVSQPYYRKDYDHLMLNSLVTSPLFGLDDSRLSSEDNSSDTSETYLLYRIDKLLKEELSKQKAAGKSFVDDKEIDHLISSILKQELGKND